MFNVVEASCGAEGTAPARAASLTQPPSAFNAHLVEGCIWLAIQLKDGCHNRPSFNINVCIRNKPINSLVTSFKSLFYHSMNSILDLVSL